MSLSDSLLCLMRNSRPPNIWESAYERLKQEWLQNCWISIAWCSPTYLHYREIVYLTQFPFNKLRLDTKFVVIFSHVVYIYVTIDIFTVKSQSNKLSFNLNSRFCSSSAFRLIGSDAPKGCELIPTKPRLTVKFVATFLYASASQPVGLAQALIFVHSISAF